MQIIMLFKECPVVFQTLFTIENNPFGFFAVNCTFFLNDDVFKNLNV